MRNAPPSESTIGGRIEAARLRAKLARKDACKLLGVTDQTLRNWVSNTHIPNGLQLLKMCAVFSVSSDYILGTPIVVPPRHSLVPANAWHRAVKGHVQAMLDAHVYESGRKPETIIFVPTQEVDRVVGRRVREAIHEGRKTQ